MNSQLKVAHLSGRLRTAGHGPLGVFALLFLAFFVRFAFIKNGHLPFESDEAIVGLMARHILYDRERPIFYYGQSYLGPLEPVSAAVSFAVFGSSLTSLRLAPTLYSLVFAFFTYLYARRAHGYAAGLATLTYLAIPPLFLLTWSVKARGGYAEIVALGSIILWLVLVMAESKVLLPWHWVALGAIGGLAFWTDPLAIVYLLPSVVFLCLRLRSRLIQWTPFLALAAFVIASAPMLIANLQSRGETFRELAGPNVSESVSLLSYRLNLSAIVRESLPTLLGFFQASSNRPAFLAAQSEGIWSTHLTTSLMILLTVGIVVLGMVSIWNALRLRPRPDDLLIWVAACTLALFCVSQVEVLYLTEPRYLLPLYAVVPILGGVWSRLWAWRPALAVVVLSLVVALNVSSILGFSPALAAPRLDGQVVDAGDPSLAAFVEAQQVRSLYADYWLSYPVAFQSGERVIPSVVDSQFAVGFNRYVPYAVAVQKDSDPAILVVANSPTEERLKELLQRSGRNYQISRWHNLDLFHRVRPALRPGQV